MQLTIEHILPYLSHHLKVKCADTGEILTATGFSHSLSFKSSSIECTTVVNGEDLCRLMTLHDEGDGEYMIPYLRPLSQLTQEILRGAGWTDHVDFCTHELKYKIAKGRFPNDMPYEKMLWLFKNHYDVFGLIEQGLALPIQ